MPSTSMLRLMMPARASRRFPLPSRGDNPGLSDDWEFDEDLRRARQLVEYHAVVKSSPSRLDLLSRHREPGGREPSQLDFVAANSELSASLVPSANVTATTDFNTTTDVTRQRSSGLSPERREAFLPIFFAGAGLLGGLCAMTTAQTWPQWLPLVLLAELGLAVMIAIFNGQRARVQLHP